MILRTYGRRSRSTFSDSFSEEDNDNTLFENHPQDFCNLPFSSSSQESSAFWSSSFDPDPFSFNSSQDTDFPSDGVVLRKPKRQKNELGLVKPLTSTLMEAQEFGEMMEHVDEVNFALDGLKKGQPVRIRRASLASLLSICGNNSQRRLLRAQGMAKTIIDAILGLSFDDSSSNLAAATLFYALTSDGLDDQLLESPSSIRFLIKLLKPVTSAATENKTQNIGSKLLALRRDSDILKDTSKAADSNSTAILDKVLEILVSCKDMKPHDVSNNGAELPELNPKWIALLAMEKACLSKISFEDTTGTVRKAGGNFKEKFRELGGLDAVFEVAMNCHSVMESLLECYSPSQDSPSQDAKDGVNLQSLVLLLKCLKIMENATFLSKDNQSHLLGMKGSLNGCRLSFTKLIISVIKILSGLHLLQQPSLNSIGGKQCSLHDGSEHGLDLALITDFKDKNEVVSISSSSGHSEERSSLMKSFDASQKSTVQFSHFASTSDTSTTLTQDTLKLRIDSSMSSSCSESLRSNCDVSLSSGNGSRNNFGLLGKSSCSKDPACQLMMDSEDPFAFDDDEFQPSKWDLLYGKRKKPSRSRKASTITKQPEIEYNYQLMSQEESSHDTSYQLKSSDEKRHSLEKNDCPNASSEEYSSLLGDCLLTAVKVLMNLTNDNPIGCQQIAACGGLESISSLIADHFPSFGMSLSHPSEMKEDNSGVVLERQNEIRLADHELDFLVAILGLLVNLVEKDGQNRSRLAATTVSLPHSEGSQIESRRDVISLLCSIFLANQGAGDAAAEGDIESWNDEAALLQGEKEAEKMILEAYAALLLAFLSTESKSTREYIADHLPDRKMAILVPVLERFVAFHLTLNMISSETHKAVTEVIESCRMP